MREARAERSKSGVVLEYQVWDANKVASHTI